MPSHCNTHSSRRSDKEFPLKTSCATPSACYSHGEKELNGTKQMQKVKINLHKECKNLSSFSLKMQANKLNNAFIPVRQNTVKKCYSNKDEFKSKHHGVCVATFLMQDFLNLHWLLL